MTSKKIIHPKWSFNEFVGFLLIHAAFADNEFSQEEQDTIKKKLSKEQVDELIKYYKSLSIRDINSVIRAYKGVYYPTSDQKLEILDAVSTLFYSDGEYSDIEVQLMEFLRNHL